MSGCIRTLFAATVSVQSRGNSNGPSRPLLRSHIAGAACQLLEPAALPHELPHQARAFSLSHVRMNPLGQRSEEAGKDSD